MKTTKNILVVFGTRPEAIKMAPVIRRLTKVNCFNVKLCNTAQHRKMSDQIIDFFKITPDFDLNVMKNAQDLSEVTASIILGLRNIFNTWKPDWILVHGDTATTLAASISAFYAKIPIAHVEAGLRTHDKYSPWPEEINRTLVTRLADLHFAPTAHAQECLIAEGILPSSILVTGNTVIDALFDSIEILKNDNTMHQVFEKDFSFLDENKPLILVTAHRRENFGADFENFCHALLKITEENKAQIIYPVHLNPNIQEPAYRILSKNKSIFLVAPQEYIRFIYLMKRAKIIITDSGGIQEEAPSLGKPVLVIRNTTERPEAVIAGTVKLVGINEEEIRSSVNKLLTDPVAYNAMASAHNPYGDGKAAERIIDALKRA